MIVKKNEISIEIQMFEKKDGLAKLKKNERNVVKLIQWIKMLNSQHLSHHYRLQNDKSINQ